MNSNMETYNNYETYSSSFSDIIFCRAYDVTRPDYMANYYPFLPKDCQQQIDNIRQVFFKTIQSDNDMSIKDISEEKIDDIIDAHSDKIKISKDNEHITSLAECKWGIKCINVKKGICKLAHNLHATSVVFKKTKMCTSVLSDNICRYGNKCTFAHSQSELYQCRYDNRCINTKCSFFHPSRVIEDVSQTCTSVQENAWTKILEWSKIINEDSYATSVSQCKSLNKTKMCKSISIGGPCKHGYHCRYAHDESELQKRPCRNGFTCQNKKWCHFSH